MRRSMLDLYRLMMFSAAVVGGLVCAANVSADEPADTPATKEGDTKDGWISLFDGKTFDGWKVTSENPKSWTIEDGAFKCEGERAHLFYVGDAAPFTDCVFTCKVKTTPGSNSGIYFSTKYQAEGWPKYGFEAQVNNSGGDPKRTASVYSVKDVMEQVAKDNEWFDYTITIKGKTIEIAINGKTVNTYTEPDDAKAADASFERRLTEGGGTFAFQAHDPKSVVYFKDVKVKKMAD